MLAAERIDALLFAYDDDIYNRPADLEFLTAAYPDSVELVGYDCEGGHNTHIDDCQTAETGAIVVALIDDEEATLKRFRRHGKSIALEPANTDYETRIFPPERVQIQGRLICLLRQY